MTGSTTPSPDTSTSQRTDQPATRSPSHRSATDGSRALGPVVPSTDARVVQRTLGIGEVEITGGPFGRWQQVNRAASIPLALEHLQRTGTMTNLRLAAGSSEDGAEYAGPRFADSDLYKTLEAIAWECARSPEPVLETFLAEAASICAAAQGEDGYLNSYYQVVKPDQRYAELALSHEMYCAGHLIQAAVAADRAGIGSGLFEVARKFADHLVEVFGLGGHKGIDGHPEVETALVELYRVTGEPNYLALAERLVNGRGFGTILPVGPDGAGARYLQDHLPVRDAETAVGHSVRQLYLDAGVLDVAAETGDAELLDSTIRRWDDMLATKTYVTGGFGSRHAGESFGDRYELPPDRAYTETCAAIAGIQAGWRLLLATGDGRYADLIERALYNAFAAGTSADGTRFFYVNPLQRRADHVEGDDPGRRRDWYTCACCPPNIMRLVASLGHYVATTTADTVGVHQFVPGTINATVDAGPVTLTAETDYPWEPLVAYTVRRTGDDEWTLALRIPAWSPSATVTVNGEPVESGSNGVDRINGYIRLTRSWSTGDRVELTLDLTPRVTYPHRRIDAVRGSAAVERGPLVYCFEQVDQPDGTDVEDLTLPPGAALREVAVPNLHGVGRTVRIEADAVAVRQPVPDGLPYLSYEPADDPALQTDRVTAVAVPYFQWDNRDGGPMRVWLPTL